jgi:hypothetical protein
MTTVMPRPFQSIGWTIEGVQRAVANSTGKAKIDENDAQTFKYFHDGVRTQTMTNAMAREIAWLNGATFPWAIEPNHDLAKPRTPDEQVLMNFARSLQSTYRGFDKVLTAAKANSNISHTESQRLNDILEGLKVGVGTLEAGIEKLRENRENNRPAGEIFETIKNAVNVPGNDTRFGPFGMLVKFGAEEASQFLDTLNYRVGDYDKKKEVIELLFDTASSPYGNLVLDRAAANKMKEAWDHLGLDWGKAVDAYKEEHPIVALYAVAIDTEINNGNTNVRELESMLRAGEAAYSELGVGFVRSGPVAAEGAVMPAASAALSGPSHRAERNEHVRALGTSLDALRARIAELKAQA